MIVAIVSRKGHHSSKAIESGLTTPQCQKILAEISINDGLDPTEYLVDLVVRTTILNQSQETVRPKWFITIASMYVYSPASVTHQIPGPQRGEGRDRGRSQLGEGGGVM